jgi:hypothetical protein
MCQTQIIVLKILKNRRHSWIGNRIRHNEFAVNILDGAISGKKAVGRPRLQQLKKFARNTGGDSYKVMKKNDFATISDGKLPTNQKIEG